MNLFLDILDKSGVALELFEKTDEWDLAIKNYTHVLKLSPDLSAALRKRGIALMETQDWEAASADFNRLLELDPTDGESYLHLGEISALTGEAEAMIESLKLAIEHGQSAAQIIQTKAFEPFLETDPFKELVKGK